MKTTEYLSVIMSIAVSFLAVIGAFQMGVNVPPETSGPIIVLGFFVAIGFIVTLITVAVGYKFQKNEIMNFINGFCASVGAIVALTIITLPETTHQFGVLATISEFILMGFIIAIGLIIALCNVGHYHKLPDLFQVT